MVVKNKKNIHNLYMLTTISTIGWSKSTMHLKVMMLNQHRFFCSEAVKLDFSVSMPQRFQPLSSICLVISIMVQACDAIKA